jgi:hypothetical protein
MLCDQLTVDGAPCKKHAMNGATSCAAHLGLVGPKSTLTPEVADRIVALLSAGNYVQVAIRACGVARRTYTDWLAKGREGDPEFEAFAERVDRARAEGEARNVAQIARAAGDSWQAAAWLLERMAPERWGRVSVRLRDVAPPESEVPIVTDEDDPFREVDELAERRHQRTG